MIDPAAATFEHVAAEYEFGRPSWPGEAVASLGLPRSAGVVELGAGTGKLTRVLLEQFERVVAVEPLDGMRVLIPARADVRAGTAEDIPLSGSSADAVVCGESFHWFDWPRAIAEIARVLRPRGVLAMMWNRAPAGAGLDHVVPGVGRVLDRIDRSPGAKRYHAFAWREAFEGSPFFGPPICRLFPHEEEISPEALVARIGSWSQFTTMPPGERAAYLDEIRALLIEPSYRIRLETHLWTTRRRP